MQPPNYTSLLHHAKSICFKVSSSLPLLPALQMNSNTRTGEGKSLPKKGGREDTTCFTERGITRKKAYTWKYVDFRL